VFACASFLAAAPTTSADSSLEGAASALDMRQAHVDPALAGFAREERLAYAARVATRAADGRRIVIAFVDVPDLRLDDYRDRLYQRLRLGEKDGTLVVATPVSITMRTPNLTPDAELAIIRLDSRALDMPVPRPYTNTLAELVYDTGLVIHNTTPGAAPRGGGRERNLATFSGRFADEAGAKDDSAWARVVLPLAGVTLLASVLIAAGAVVLRRTTRPPD
jgi:hypothetical protein